MKNLIVLFITLLSASLVYSQTYNIETEDGNTVSTCSGTLYDSGGAGGDYGTNESFQVTICPDTPGDVVRIEFALFELQFPGGGGACNDWVEVFNGTGTGGDNLSAGALCGTQTGLSFTSTAADGCLTITFDSNQNQNFPGFEGVISCRTPCETPIAALVDNSEVTFCSPTADNATTPYTVNVDASPSTVGSYISGAYSIDEYVWDWGDGTTSSTATATTSHDYTTPGIYTISLVVNDDNPTGSPNGCSSTNEATKKINVAPAPDIQTAGGAVNCGDCLDIETVATSQTEAEEPPTVPSAPIALPDIAGDCFTNSVDYTGLFPDGATVDAGCYPDVCLDLDHSWAGDLIINLIAPTGESVMLFNRSFGGDNFGDCTTPLDDGVPGCPRTYCFVPTGGATTANSDAGASCGTCDPADELGDYILAGDYIPAGAFSDLDGADLNGSWTIEVCDMAGSDDGTLHGWSLSFPPSCFRALDQITPDISSVAWTPDGTEATFTVNETNTAVFEPGPDACPDGELCEGNELNSTATVCFDNPTSDGTYVYDYLVTDEYGCEYSGSMNIDLTCPCSAEAELTISGLTEICSGDNSELTFNITGGGGTTYDVVYSDGTTNFTLNDLSQGLNTVSVSPATTTTYSIVSVYDDGGACSGTVSGSGVITVDPVNTVTPASSTPTLCANTALTDITHTTTEATGIANDGVDGANGLPAGVSAAWAGDVITISGTPTATGTFNYSILLTGGCGTVNATGTITVDPANTVTPASSTPTLCANTALTDITHTTTEATGIANDGVDGANGLPAGVSAAWAGDVITISGTPTATGTFNYSILLTGGCGTVNATGTITVDPANTVTPASSTPTLCANTTLTDITHTTTEATGIANNGVDGANGLPAGVSATWAGDVITISGTPTATGTFNYSILLTGGCGTVNATGTITVDELPVIDAVGNDPSSCGNNDGSIDVNLVSGPLNTGELSWSGAGVGTDPAADLTVNPNITGLESGTYNVLFTDDNGCVSNTENLALNNPGAPIIDPISDTVSCVDYTLDISSVTGASLVGPQFYSEADGPSGTGVLIPDGTTFSAFTDTTIYVYDENGACSAEIFFNVTINTTPTLTLQDSTTCSPNTVDLSNTSVWSTDVGTLTWYSNAGLTTVLSPLTVGDGIYYAEADNEGCTSDGSVTITVNTTPTLTLQDSTVCAGDLIDITNTSEWSTDVGTLSYFESDGTTPLVDPTAVGEGTYIIEADNSGCVSSDPVTVSEVPSIVALNSPGDLTAACDISEEPPYADFDEFIAAGGSVTIDPAGAIDSASFVLDDQVSAVAGCAETFTRTYLISDTCGATVTVEQDIVVEDDIDPTGTAPSDETVQCIADIPMANINLIIDEDDNCTTNPTVTHVGDVTTGAACSEVVTRTYRIQDACGNFIEVDQVFTVQDDTDPTASNPSPIVVQCDTDVPTPNTSEVTDALDNCTAAPTVTFIGDVSDDNVCNGEVITRTYEVEDDCGNTTRVQQTITIESYAPNFTLSGTNPTTCGGADGFITVSGLEPNTDYTFEYGGNAPATITSNGAGEYVISGLAAGDYTGFTMSDIDCPSCSTTDGSTITLEDPNAPDIDAGTDQEVCGGEPITLTANNPDGAIITWDNGVTDGEAFTPEEGTTTYTVTADLGGCISTDEVVVNVIPQPIADFTADPISGGAPLEVDFFNNSVNAADYSWDFGNGQTGTSDEETALYSTPGTYEVLLTATNDDCTDQASITINAIQLPLSYTIPNVITPNGDDSNDMLQMNLENAESVEIEIFNRWGNLVGTVNSIDPDQGWDGTNLDTGNPVADGVYFYTYKITSIYGEVVEGHQYIHVTTGEKE